MGVELRAYVYLDSLQPLKSPKTFITYLYDSSKKISIPLEILRLVEQLTIELEEIEKQASVGLDITSLLLERFPNNSSLIGISATLNNALFFVNNFKTRIQTTVEIISSANLSASAIQEVGEELSEYQGRAIECKMMVDKVNAILLDLQ